MGGDPASGTVVGVLIGASLRVVLLWIAVGALLRWHRHAGLWRNWNGVLSGPLKLLLPVAPPAFQGASNGA